MKLHLFLSGFTDYTVPGVVKGSVVFICDSDKQRELEFLDFQGSKDFENLLNGWHSSKPIKPTRPNTTSVNHTERTISMWDLKVSDEGKYKCIISYKDSLDGTTKDTIIFLNMTGFTDYTVTGVVKGSVVFICDSDKQRELEYLYFQGGNDFKIFLNGWHSSKSFPPTQPNTTSVNHTERTISMWDLKVSDKGEYKCIISYKDSSDGTTEDTIIHLKMTANHSAPTITHRNCEKVGEGYCTLTCTAIGVFPVSKIAWDVPLVLEQRWTEVNHSDTVVQDINTLLYNISSTANFSCPGELQQNTSCSVGGVSSVKTPVCQQHNGVVKGSVEFICDSGKQRELKFIYFQGGKDIFLNGWHSSKSLEPTRPETTSVNHTERTISIAPTITHRNCEKVGEGYCTLTCTAIGVFPVSKIAWDVPLVLEQRRTEVNHSDTVVQDINTLLYNISSTANFSCPGELQQNTSCSVGGVSSVKTPVCQQHNGKYNLGKRANGLS
ncbi:hypothetical protein N1851_008465 [Merluccius polli]|uniref:Ig-like domain-containing protein n=1 Tax=Merluccius polli TaxID=89951 RepID=A0AA47N1E1_MERPO|nr:hypothetical protein N1851_008465 [Merluccius polli]